MAYVFTIDQYQSSSKQLKFSFPSYSDYQGYSNQKPPEGLFETKGILEYTGLVHGKDFTIEQNSIVVTGRAHVITTMNMLLTPQGLFRLAYSQRDSQQYWHNRLVSLAIATMADETITKGEAAKINPLIKAYLDANFVNLKKETAYAMVSKDVREEYGDNLLHHPLYQALGLLLEELNRQKAAYNATPMLKRIGMKKPDETGFAAIFAAYKTAVPAIYKSARYEKGVEVSEIDAAKIAAARKFEVLHQQQNRM